MSNNWTNTKVKFPDGRSLYKKAVFFDFLLNLKANPTCRSYITYPLLNRDKAVTDLSAVPTEEVTILYQEEGYPWHRDNNSSGGFSSISTVFLKEGCPWPQTVPTEEGTNLYRKTAVPNIGIVITEEASHLFLKEGCPWPRTVPTEEVTNLYQENGCP